MGRTKLEFIEGTKSRYNAFHKRKNVLKKKASELSILCGVKLAMIIYAPENFEHPLQPEIWPDNRGEVLELIRMYKNQSEQVRKKRTTDLSDFLEERKRKALIDLEKSRKLNKAKAKYPAWNSQFDDLAEGQLRKFYRVLEGKLEVAKARLEVMKNGYLQQQSLLRSMELEALKAYNYQQQQGLTFGDHTNLIPNPRMLEFTNNNDYVGGESRCLYVPPPPFKLVACNDSTVDSDYVNNIIVGPPMRHYNIEAPEYYMPDPFHMQAPPLQMDDLDCNKNGIFQMRHDRNPDMVNFTNNDLYAPPPFKTELVLPALPEYYMPAPQPQMDDREYYESGVFQMNNLK